MDKKGTIVVIFLLLSMTLIVAQSSNYKIEIDTSKDIFEAGENITLKITLFNEKNQPVEDKVSIILEDAEKNIKIEETIQSNKFVSIDPTTSASYGQGKITAKYNGVQSVSSFVIGIEELAFFEIKDDYLVITNIGNTRYTKTIQITIGETTRIKEPKLDQGKSVKYRLIAPEGTYQIRVTDGKTTLTKGDVHLTGTGQVVGALDESGASSSGITGINPEEDSEGDLVDQLKTSKFVYVFILVVFGATILLAIERRYRKKL